MTYYFCPAKASNGHHFYVYDAVPGLTSEFTVSKRLSLVAFERVALLLQEGRTGYELAPHKWTSHLQAGHDAIELHHIRPADVLLDEVRLLKAVPRGLWKPEWLEAEQFIQRLGTAE
jgi:hypothetical protein